MFKLTCSSQQDRVTESSNRIKVVALWNVGGACTGLTCGTLQEAYGSRPWNAAAPVERCKDAYGSHLWNVAGTRTGLTRGTLQGRVRVLPVGQAPRSFRGRICDVVQVPGSFRGRICDVDQYQDSSQARFLTLNRYQDRSGAGCTRIDLGQDF